MADGLTEAQARCVSQGYRVRHPVSTYSGTTGTTLGPDRLAAHEDLDVFLNAATQGVLRLDRGVN